MEDKTTRIKRLLESTDWSQEDELWFLNYVSNDDLTELRAVSQDQFENDLSEAHPKLERGKSEEILGAIHKSITILDEKTFRINKQWWWAAATLIFAVSIALYYHPQSPTAPVIAKKTERVPADITPGRNVAYLTLADGSRILLDDKKNGAISRQGDATIIKTGEMVSYNKSKTLNAAKQISYNTVTTPRGGQYQVILPDGSKVWLNAASSIRFPVAFSDKERVIEITGEAYFEVAKRFGSGTGSRRIPFLVKTSTQVVEVLGTHFNVSAYSDEDMVKTTLLEGSVKVSGITSNQARVLVPGQQSRISAGQLIDVTDANLDEVLAWKNGSFLFDDEELTSIMRKISRWYDVDVVYKGKPENLYFGGMVSRSKNISSVLKIMESTKNVHFRIEGRRVLVMP